MILFLLLFSDGVTEWVEKQYVTSSQALEGQSLEEIDFILILTLQKFHLL